MKGERKMSNFCFFRGTANGEQCEREKENGNAMSAPFYSLIVDPNLTFSSCLCYPLFKSLIIFNISSNIYFNVN